MDNLEQWETYYMVQNLQYTDTNSWEQCRLHLHTLSSMFSKKKIEPKDIMSLPWDNKKEKGTTEISDADILRLKNKASLIYGNNTNKINK